MWKQVAKETAQGPPGTNSLNNANYSSGTPVQHHPTPTARPSPLTHVHPSAVEDILVKIEPHQLMTNGDDEESSSSRGGGGTGTTSDGNIYSIVQQAAATAHGNHSQRANNYVNGATIDASSSSTSNTNDGFMLGLYFVSLFIHFFFVECFSDYFFETDVQLISRSIHSLLSFS